MRRPHRYPIAHALALAFVAPGPWSRAGLLARAAATFGERPRWTPKVVSSVLARWPEAPPRAWDLERFLRDDAKVRDACDWHEVPLVRRLLVPELAMLPGRWPVVQIATTGDLARWLDLSPNELEWLADARGLERLAKDERLLHYEYRWVRKRTGGARLLEAPKRRTKAIQRRILAEILDVIPPHDAAHGFRRHRSTATHAAPHASKAVVLRMDLSEFFLSISAARVASVFRAAGYPDEVAWALTALSTNIAPTRGASELRATLGTYATRADLAAIHRAETLARTRHLPQGAPTSPALANLCAYALDVRLTAAAASWNARYTRYADDLVFSGDASFARGVERFAALAAGIALDEGFVVNHRKTRVMRRGGRQLVTGLVVNRRPRPARSEYDRLKAILHNCARHGPASQNREGLEDLRAHLAGRVAYLAGFDEAWGRKLRAAFDAIVWPEPAAET